MKHFYLALLLFLQIPLVVNAAEAYAVYSGWSTLRFYYDDLKNTRDGKKYQLNTGNSIPSWHYENISTVVFDSSFSEARPTSTCSWFQISSINGNHLTEIVGIQYLNTSNVTTMNSMFEGCYKLTSLDVSHFNTENVTDMCDMFCSCSSLTSLDVSNFNTENVTNMYRMFYNCTALTSLDVSHFNTGNVTTMGSMFCGCSKLTSLDVSNFNTEKVTRMEWMFQGCSSLTFLDLSNFNTEKVTGMSCMFYDCTALTSLDVSNFNTANVTNMSTMFQGCSALTSLDVTHFNTTNVTDMGSMFCSCSSLTSLDVSNFNTENVTDMSYMFSSCSSLTSLDISNFDTEKVSDMEVMFQACTSLTSLVLNNFNTANVTNMYRMFYNCTALTSLDVSNFSTENVTNMSSMFQNCSALTYLDVSNFNTENVTDMRYMFQNCSALTYLDVSNFNTENVTDMHYMFHGCSAMTSLDLSNFNTVEVTDMVAMLEGCTNLKTIYVGEGWTTDKVKYSYKLFLKCTSLVGGAGTTYDASHVDKEYAHIDGGPSNPGYLTYKATAISVDNSDDLQDFINGLGDNKGTEEDPVQVPVGNNGLTIDKDVDIDDLQLFIDGSVAGSQYLPLRYANGTLNIHTGSSFSFSHVVMSCATAMSASHTSRRALTVGGCINSGKMRLNGCDVRGGTVVNSGSVYTDGATQIDGLQNQRGGRLYVTSVLTQEVSVVIADVSDVETGTPVILGGDDYTLTETDAARIHLSLPEGYEWKYDNTTNGIMVSASTGIIQTKKEQSFVIGTYDARGGRVDAKSKGLQIQRMSDGIVRKVINK